MTRKDYVLIAQSFATTLDTIRTTMVLDKDNYAEFGVECAARGLALQLSYDNPRFDAERFLQAATVTECGYCGFRATYHGTNCPNA